MRRPLGWAALVVSAPFSLAVARLHCSARLVARSFARLGRRAGRLGRLPFKCNLRWLAPTGQTPAHLVCSGCSPIPPETRKVSGYAPRLSFSRSVSTDYRLLTQSVKRFVLADKDCVFVSNFLFVGCLKKKMRTDKLFSLHSFITVTWFLVYIRGVRRFVPQCLITPPIKHRGSKGRLIDLLPDFVGSQNYHRRLKLTTSSVGRTLIRHCSTVLLFLCVSLWR